MMPAPPRSKLVRRIWGCEYVQYSSKMLRIGFVFLGNRFRVTNLLLGTVKRKRDDRENGRFTKCENCDNEKRR